VVAAANALARASGDNTFSLLLAESGALTIAIAITIGAIAAAALKGGFTTTVPVASNGVGVDVAVGVVVAVAVTVAAVLTVAVACVLTGAVVGGSTGDVVAVTSVLLVVVVVVVVVILALVPVLGDVVAFTGPFPFDVTADAGGDTDVVGAVDVDVTAEVHIILAFVSGGADDVIVGGRAVLFLLDLGVNIAGVAGGVVLVVLTLGELDCGGVGSVVVLAVRTLGESVDGVVTLVVMVAVLMRDDKAA
jgi:hypothetical protein